MINANVLKSSSVSFATGLPGGFAMAATIPADVAQFYDFVLKLAQEISYIYGYDNLFDENEELTDEAHDALVLYLGVMFGVTAASSTIRVVSKQASQKALKSIPNKALTKTFYCPILKNILKTFGYKLTKDQFAKGISKAIPFVGGAVSGGLNYTSMKPMARRLNTELSKIVDYTEKDLEKDIKIIEQNR
ncbi:bacteriochlorophyll 4-vinyl reductase [Staphylococcus equorum]|uniref:bacteriochlorophyll 4-vinyl reductase n=1 Tax=Staphylococcus equorum TaxID=246432 RepID=UPI003EB91AF6